MGFYQTGYYFTALTVSITNYITDLEQVADNYEQRWNYNMQNLHQFQFISTAVETLNAVKLYLRQFGCI